jgi:hypothetical protein
MALKTVTTFLKKGEYEEVTNECFYIEEDITFPLNKFSKEYSFGKLRKTISGKEFNDIKVKNDIENIFFAFNFPYSEKYGNIRDKEVVIYNLESIHYIFKKFNINKKHKGEDIGLVKIQDDSILSIENRNLHDGIVLSNSIGIYNMVNIDKNFYIDKWLKNILNIKDLDNISKTIPEFFLDTHKTTLVDIYLHKYVLGFLLISSLSYAAYKYI